MEIKLQNGGSVQVADGVFARDFNEGLVHQAVVAYMAAARAGTKAQKTRAEVRGGNVKPWRQKGTGRARHGSTRTPIWRTGGRAFAAQPRDYEQKINRKAYRAAMSSIFSELVRQGRLVVVDAIDVEAPKTKLVASMLQGMGLKGVTLLVPEVVSENLYLAARNLGDVGVLDPSALDPVSLVGSDQVVITVGALKMVEEWLS
ncbi:50S ribosomal protein L4 [Thiofaba sp. EF100]|uniref:50S ribosomal protein L4 n=1 Tax=Thiofaba sp. EF100 TaxID=3121274 RepID=UPI003221C543